jgi:hypothetical protein
MNTASVRSILRIVAVITILVGDIGASTVAISTLGVSRFMESASQGTDLHMSVSGMGGYAVLAWLVVAAWGAALYVLSPFIARHITSEPGQRPALREPLARGETARE